MIKNLFRKRNRKPSRKVSRKSFFEPLEERRLLAGDIFEANDSPGNATRLGNVADLRTLSATVHAVQPTFSGVGAPSHVFDVSRVPNPDWYQFSPETSGQTRISLDSSNGVYMSLYDSSNNRISTTLGASSRLRGDIVADLNAGEQYFLLVTASTTTTTTTSTGTSSPISASTGGAGSRVTTRGQGSRDQRYGSGFTFGNTNPPRTTTTTNTASSIFRTTDYQLTIDTPTPPSTLRPDRFEPNDLTDDPPSPTVISGTGTELGLTIHDSEDTDVFLVTLESPGRAADSVSISFANGIGDLDLYLAGNDIEVRSSRSTSDRESISLEGVPAGTYIVAVVGFQGATGRYDIDFDLPIAPDHFEPNDRLPPSAIIDSNLVDNLTTHTPTDVDFFKVVLSATGGSGDFIAITFDSEQANLDMLLFSGTEIDPDTVVGFSSNPTGPERISLERLPAGEYLLAIFASDDGITEYQLEVDLPEPVGAIPEDRFEPNDTRANALEVAGSDSLNGLSIHNSADEDYFKIELQADGTAENFIAITFVDEIGDLDLQLLDSSGTVVDRSLSVTDNERISLDGVSQGVYYARVYGYQSDTNVYNIDFVLPTGTTATAVFPDRLEVNDNRLRATPLSQTALLRGLSIHNTSDVDFFKFTIDANEVLTDAHFVGIAFSHAQGDLDLWLQDDNGTTIRQSLGVSDFEDISLAGLPAGDYFIRVDGFRGAEGYYDLYVELPGNTIRPDVLEPNDTRVLATRSLGADNSNKATPVSQDTVYSDLSIHNATDQDYFSFEIPAGVTASATNFVAIQFTHAAGDLDLELYGSDGTLLRRSTGTSNREEISLAGLQSGNYFVRAFGYRGATGTYRATFDLPEATGLSADAFEPNDSVANAKVLQQDSLIQNLTIHDSSDLDFFQFTSGDIGRRGDGVSIVFSHAVGDLDLLLLDENGALVEQVGIVSSSVSSTDDEFIDFNGLPAGTYNVVVAGYNGALNSYALAITFPETALGSTPDQFETNDTLQDATHLRESTTIDGLSIHSPTDIDVFAFNLPQEGRSGGAICQPNGFCDRIPTDFVAIGFSQTVGSGDLALQLLNSSGAVLRESNLSVGVGQFTQRELITLGGLAAGDYFVRVAGVSGQTGTYDLTLRVPDIDEGRPDEFEPNDAFANASDLRILEGRIDPINLTIHAVDGSSNDDYFRFTTVNAGGSTDFIQIAFAHADGDLNLSLLDSSGSELRTSNSTTNNERISLNGLPAGEYGLRVNGVGNATNSYVLEGIAPVRSSFDIEIQYVDNNLTGVFRDAFENAADRWEQIIVGDVPNWVVRGDYNVPLVGGGSFQISGGRQIDDVLILAGAPEIDGLGNPNTGRNILGAAGAKLLRSGSQLPYLGVMGFDIADLQQMQTDGILEDVIFHEMGHVLLSPDSWDRLGLRQGGSSPVPKFVGQNALAEYKTLFNEPSATFVPLEDNGRQGSHGSHWDEEIFGNEIMSPTIFGLPNPISRVTIAAAEDMGYAVSYSLATYSPPGSNLVQGAGEGNGVVFDTGLIDDIEVDDTTDFAALAVAPIEQVIGPDIYEGMEPLELRQNAEGLSRTIHSRSDVDTFTFTLAGRGTADHSLSVTSDLDQPLELVLRDSTGTQTLSRNLLNGQAISLAGWAAGTYTVEVSSPVLNRYSVLFSGQFQAVEPTVASLDLDGDGVLDPTTDGFLVTLSLLGHGPNSLERFSNGFSGVDIQNRIALLSDALDLDGDGVLDPSTDGFQAIFGILGAGPNQLRELSGTNAWRSGQEIQDRIRDLQEFAPSDTSSESAAPSLSTVLEPQLQAEAEGERVDCRISSCTQVFTFQEAIRTGETGSFQFDVDYETQDEGGGVVDGRTGLISFTLFFNSAEIDPASFGPNAVSTDIPGFDMNFVVDDDTGNGDEGEVNSRNTDKFVVLTWLDFLNRDLPGDLMETPLAQLNLQLRDGVSMATINVTEGNQPLTEQRFVGTPLIVDFSGPAAPTVTISGPASPVLEDSGQKLVYTFTRTGDTTAALTANFNVSGDATFNTDYTQTGAASFSTSTGTVTFAAGSATATVTIDPIADTNDENNETAILTLTTGTGYTIGTANAATGTIIDGTVPVPPSVTVAVAPASVQEDGTANLVYTFTRTGDPSASLTANFGVSGTATFNNDYTQTGAASFSTSTGTVTFLAGSATAIVTIDPTADTNDENDETAILTLTTGTGYTIGTAKAATGTIIDGTVPIPPSVTVAVAPASVQEDGTANLVYTFTRTGDPSASLTANFGVSGNATFNNDYTQTGAASFSTSTGTVTFLAGSATAIVTIDPTADTNDENNETAILTLTTGTGYTIGTANAATGTIIDDDDPVPPSVTVAVAPASVQEDGTANLVYTFARTGDPSASLTANFGVSGNATFNNDYTQTGAASFSTSTGTVTFLAGSATVAVTIDPTADTNDENNETAILTLTTGTGYTIGTANAATGTIIDDDVPVPPSVTVAVAPASVQEDGSANLLYTFTRTGDTSASLTANFGVSGNAIFNNDYTQTGAASFSTSAGTVTFPAGSATATVTIDPTADTNDENDETAILTVATGTGYTIGTANSATGTIIDDDDTRVPGFTIVESGGNTVVDESGTTDTFTVVLTTPPASNVVLDVRSSDTGEVAVVTPQLTFTPANWNVPQTVTVQGVIDGRIDGKQTRNVTVSVNQQASDAAYASVPPQSVAAMIRDANVGIPIDLTVAETGTAATFPLVLEARPISNVVLLLESSDITEATVSPASITFTPDNWDTRQFVTVTGVDDDLEDGDQTSIITVRVDGPNSDDAFDALPDKTLTVLTKDDEAGASISGSVYADVNNNGRRDAGESGIANVEVRLSGAENDVAFTDPNGNYSFLELTAGNYTITEIQPLAYIDGADTPGTGGGTAGNDVFQVTIQGLDQLRDYNFGERGLQAQFVSTCQFLARPTCGALNGLTVGANAEGESSAVTFTTNGNGQLTLTAEGEATLELFDATMNSVARSVGGVLSTSVYKGEGYVLYVSSGGAATELHAASSVDLVTGAIALHNRGLTTDVNFDGSTSPVDALIIINHLNAPGSGFATPTFADVSGDRIVSPIDVLQIINLLNGNTVTVSAEGEADTGHAQSPFVVPPGTGAVDFAPAIARPNTAAPSRNVEDAIAVIAPQPYPSDATNELHTRLFARSTDDTDFTHNDLESAIDSIADDLAELWQ
jgi:hypothetical protein